MIVIVILGSAAGFAAGLGGLAAGLLSLPGALALWTGGGLAAPVLALAVRRVRPALRRRTAVPPAATSRPRRRAGT